MALGSQPRWTVRSADAQVGIDVGLRDYMLRVYNYMASGLALTGIVAYVAAASGFYMSIARTPLIWLVILAPLGLAPWLLGYAGLSYGIVAAVTGAIMIALAFRLRAERQGHAACKQMFAFSILYLFLLFAFLLVDQAFAGFSGSLFGHFAA